MKRDEAEQLENPLTRTSQLPIDYNSLFKEVLANSHPTFNPPPPKPMKNKRKPEWAFSSEQREELEDKEAQDLISFMDGLDIEKYKEDVEVRNIISNLKNRIEELHDNLTRSDADDRPQAVFLSQARLAHLPQPDVRGIPADERRLPSKDEFGLAVASSQKRIKSGIPSQKAQQTDHRPLTAAGKKGAPLLTEKLRTLIVKRIADAILKSDSVASVEQETRSGALERFAAADDRGAGD